MHFSVWTHLTFSLSRLTSKKVHIFDADWAVVFKMVYSIIMSWWIHKECILFGHCWSNDEKWKKIKYIRLMEWHPSVFFRSKNSHLRKIALSVSAFILHLQYFFLPFLIMQHNWRIQCNRLMNANQIFYGITQNIRTFSMDQCCLLVRNLFFS